eukprot:525034_1
MDEFFRKCYFKKPCLIDTTIDQWTNATFWQKDNFLSAFGNYSFDSGKSLNLVLNAGVGELKTTLRQYIESNDNNENNYQLKEPMYIFDRTIWDTEQKQFRNNHINRKNIPFYDFASSKIDYNGAILALGNTGTGATFHAHGENWLFLVSGRKRWFLFPPNLEPVGGFWPGYSTKDWFKFIYPYLHKTYREHEYNPQYNKPRSSIYHRTADNGETIDLHSASRDDIVRTDDTQMNDDAFYGNSFFKPLECIQRKGQIIYLPEFWWHSVLNLGNVVMGAAVQTSHARTPWLFERNVHDEVRHGVNYGGKNWTDLEENAERMEGIHAYKRLTRYGPISAVHHFFMGFEFYDMGEYTDAIKHLTNALLMDPTYLEAYSYLSHVYSHDDPNNVFYDMDKAEDILRIAYILNPNNDSIQDELLRLFSLTEQHDLAGLVRERNPLPPK